MSDQSFGLVSISGNQQNTGWASSDLRPDCVSDRLARVGARPWPNVAEESGYPGRSLPPRHPRGQSEKMKILRQEGVMINKGRVVIKK